MQDSLVGSVLLGHVKNIVVLLDETDGARHHRVRLDFASDLHSDGVCVLFTMCQAQMQSGVL
jgi:hypothetical protein